ncbi:MAG: glycosyltransferase family 39 protein [Anaerolineales bacterium]|nr:glycosyltransferase family 39 protein [Anaerolineales bacterium]
MSTWLNGRRAALFLAAVLALLHALTLLRYPAPHVDEAWLTSRAWGFLHTGRQYGPLDAGLTDQFPGYWTVNQWLITALQAAALSLSQAPALLPLRLLALAFGGLLLWANYRLAFRLGGPAVAATATLLLAASRAFFHSAHLARYDVLATMLGYAALALAVYHSRRGFFYGLAAGALAGLAVETHLNSLIFLPALGLVYLLEGGRQVWRNSAVWGFALGLGLGAAFYLGLHVLPYPQTYATLNRLLFSQTHTPPIVSLEASRILAGFSGSASLLLVASGSMLVLGVLALPLLARRRTAEARLALAINLALFLGAALLIPNITGHYAIFLAPAFLWPVAEFLVDFASRPWQGKAADYAWRVLAWGAVAGALALSAVPLLTDNAAGYRRAQQAVNAAVQPGDVLMGSQVFWLGLYDHRYYSWELLIQYPRLYPEATLAEALAHYRPDLLVIDGPMDDLISDSIDPASRWSHYSISRAELEAFLSEKAVRVALIEGTPYGAVQAYRIRWAP